MPKWLVDDWTWLTHLDAGVQNAILIVIAVVTLIVAILAFQGFRKLLAIVLLFPLMFVWRIFNKPETIEGDILNGFKPRLEFDVSAHESGKRRKTGAAVLNGQYYWMPVYVKVKGEERSAYSVKLRFRNYCSPVDFRAENTAQLHSRVVELEGVYRVIRIYQHTPRLDGRPDLLGWVAITPHLDAQGAQLTPASMTIAYNVTIGRFSYPSTYFHSFDIKLVNE